MCNRTVNEWPWLLGYVPDQYKTEEMCYRAVERYLSSLQFVPDWFGTQQEQLKIYLDYWFVSQQQLIVSYTEWYEGYKRRKAQKARIKVEFLPIAWYSDRVIHWCMSEDAPVVGCGGNGWLLVSDNLFFKLSDTKITACS